MRASEYQLYVAVENIDHSRTKARKHSFQTCSRPIGKAYVSYCPLSRLCKGESWLLGPSTSVTLNNGVLVQRFV